MHQIQIQVVTLTQKDLYKYLPLNNPMSYIIVIYFLLLFVVMCYSPSLSIFFSGEFIIAAEGLQI